MHRGPYLAVTILAAAAVADLGCQSQTIVGLTASDEAAIRLALDTRDDGGQRSRRSGMGIDLRAGCRRPSATRSSHSRS